MRILYLLLAINYISCGQQQESSRLSEFANDDYFRVLKTIDNNYVGEIRGHGARLVYLTDPFDTSVSAWASKGDEEWTIAAGALGTSKSLNLLGFAFTICHEMGHLLAGPPYHSNLKVSAEGRADSFAIGCLKRILPSLDIKVESLQPASPIGEDLIRRCHHEHATPFLCTQMLMAGQNTIFWLAGQGTRPSFSTPDRSVVEQTIIRYPSNQCRLDIVLNATFDKIDLPCWKKPEDSPQ